MAREEVQQLTVRLPRELHEALQILGLATDRSLNDLTVGALRTYLADKGHRDAVQVFFKEAQDTYRVALDKLADL